MEELTFVQANQPQLQDQPKFEDQRPKQPKYLLILRNRLYQLAAFFTIFAFVIPFLFYYIFFDLNVTYTREPYSCFVNTTFRVPCKSNISRYECLGLGCCFDANTLQCYHSYPSRYNYHLHDERFVPTTRLSLWGTPTKPELKMSVIELDANRVQLVVYDPQVDVPWGEKTVSEKNYYVRRNDTVLSVDVEDSEGEEILTTGIGPLIASDGYWEWTFRMTDDALFGLDEFYFEDNVTTTKVIHKNRSNHTTVPVFMAYVRGGFHGLVVENPGPMELIVLPSKLVIVRSLAGSYISLTLTMGPTPRDVVEQLRTYEFQPPPQWILGPHICRDGTFNATVAVDEYQSFLGNANNTVNYASDCFHENLYFEYLQSLNEEDDEPQELGRVLETLSELQNRTRLLLSFQPQIIYEEGNPHYQLASELDLLYRNTDGEIFNGTYLSRQVAYPDLNPTSTPMVSWLQNVLGQMRVEDIAGFSLKDNWPAEDTFEMEAHASLPYLSEELRSSMSRTLQWNSSTPAGNVRHIELHNNYGGKQVELFREAIREGDSPILFTSSYSYGIDAIAQIQNVITSWSNLARVIRATLSHSILAHPLISTPVCGSTGNYDAATHESLCVRWYITAATLPIFRVSSELPRRDPASLPSGLARAEAIRAIDVRDTLLPYYYTVLSRGEPLTRPMLFDFYEDRNTFALDQQYMVGDALLVAQPLLQHTTSLRVYLPPQAEVWYEFFGGLKYEGDLGWIRLSVRETDWFVFIMQGKIVPLRRRKMFRPIDKTVKVEDASQYTYSLAVALNATDNTARGSLFLTGTYLEFVANGTHVQIQNINAARADINCDGERLLPSIVESVQVYGVESRVLTTLVDGGDADLCDVVGDTFDIPLFI